MPSDVKLIVALDTPTRNAVYRFREAVAREGRGPLNLLQGPYSARSSVGLQDLLDPFAIVVAAIEQPSASIVGAARTNFLREGSIPVYPELYGLRMLPSSLWRLSSVTSCWTMAAQFECERATAPDHPAVRLAWTLYDIALRQRICHDFLDCDDADVAFFTHLGYRRMREIAHPVRGRSNLMRLDVYDWSHLAAIKSPFLTLARGVS